MFVQWIISGTSESKHSCKLLMTKLQTMKIWCNYADTVIDVTRLTKSFTAMLSEWNRYSTSVTNHTVSILSNSVPKTENDNNLIHSEMQWLDVISEAVSTWQHKLQSLIR